MTMIRDWFNPIYSSVPRDIRLSGTLPTVLYATMNPGSWAKFPYYGVCTFVFMWIWFWNYNTWGVIKYENETVENDKWWWMMRTTLWALTTHWILLFVVYLVLMGLIKLTSIDFKGATSGIKI